MRGSVLIRGESEIEYFTTGDAGTKGRRPEIEKSHPRTIMKEHEAEIGILSTEFQNFAGKPRD